MNVRPSRTAIASGQQLDRAATLVRPAEGVVAADTGSSGVGGARTPRFTAGAAVRAHGERPERRARLRASRH